MGIFDGFYGNIWWKYVMEIFDGDSMEIFDSMRVFYVLGIPSGKRLHSYGKSPFFMGKFTISMVILTIVMLNYQMVFYGDIWWGYSMGIFDGFYGDSMEIFDGNIWWGFYGNIWFNGDILGISRFSLSLSLIFWWGLSMGYSMFFSLDILWDMYYMDPGKL